MWDIYNVEFSKAQRGWVCIIGFKIQTHRQFTMEHHTVESGATGFGIFAILKAYLNARRAIKNAAAELYALPGEFNL